MAALPLRQIADKIDRQLEHGGHEVRVKKLSEPHAGRSVYYRACIAAPWDTSPVRFNHVVEESKDGGYAIY